MRLDVHASITVILTVPIVPRSWDLAVFCSTFFLWLTLCETFPRHFVARGHIISVPRGEVGHGQLVEDLLRVLGEVACLQRRS